MENREETEEIERGVRNPRVVDLITLDPAENLVILTMIEDRPWGESEEQLEQLGEKFNNYVDYIVDGWLVKQYPQYEGKRFGIRVEGIHAPDEKQSHFFEVMKRFCADQELEFQVGTLQNGAQA